MTDTPRNVRLALALLVACAACARDADSQTRGAVSPAQAKPPVQAKPPAQAKSAAQKSAAGGKARADAARAAERLTRKAVAVLLEVADGAKSLEDPSQRASVLALCADALWNVDERAARAAFARAWEAAAEADEAELKDEREQGRYGDLPERFTRARELVLSAAARRDTRLSEGWLGALADWVKRQRASEEGDEPAPAEGGAATAGPDLGPQDGSTREGQRLTLASSLLDEGAYEEAARVAAPALRGALSGALVEFLLGLRAGSPDEADRLYLQLLASVRARGDATANDVLLLSSYVLSPRLLAAVGPDGSVSLRPVGGGARDESATAATPRETPAHVRSVFYDTAAGVLLLRPPQDSTPGRETHALYFTIGRLLPFFQRESMRHAYALQTRMIELGERLGFERSVALQEQMERLSLSPENPTDPLRGLLDTVAGASDPKLRDAARLQAVEAAAKRRLWERARRVAEEVEDEDVRRAARAVVDAYKVAWVRETYEGDDEDFEKTAALSRGAGVMPALRAFGLGQAALMAARRGERERTAALLEEAFGQASQEDAGTFARDAAMLMTAAVAARLESPRTWEVLAATVAALNDDAGFKGGPFRFDTEARASYEPGEAGALEEALAQFDISEAFEAVARRDPERAAAEARNLKSAFARSRALITSAWIALEKAGRVPAQLRPGR
ncbi:MAG TPA: hypothetical protein VF588_16950 [Pyrinomonadaceae bacterium]|jgi:hypothetical protein